jgi:methenyltetrahydromethanopterin cyclohydrolase
MISATRPYPLLGISLNQRAVAIVKRMIDDAEALGLDVIRHASGATVVDAGVKATGSLEAGRLFSEACMGGLGQVGFCELDYDGLRLPGVQVATSHPALACVAAQLAGWPVQWEDSSGRHRAMGSGPARALRGDEDILKRLSYHDCADVAVLMLEGEELPPPEVAADIASQCRIAAEGLYLLVASVASLVGTVQVSARMVEAALHKMMGVGFDVRTVLAGYGTCPLPPLSRDPLRAIGLANDAVLYGGRVWLTVETTDAQVEAVLDKLPSSASRDYGTPFYDLFERYGHDFYKIDPSLFSVAEISLVNRQSGRTFRAGQVSGSMVRRTLLP